MISFHREDNMENFEEAFVSAYCRLSYEVWYPQCKDDVSGYLQEEQCLEKALERAAAEKRDSDIIRVDGVFCENKYERRECIETILDFLQCSSLYKIVYALPYEDQMTADHIAYDYTAYQIERWKMKKEFFEEDYLLYIGSPRKYLKILPDKTGKYAVDDVLGRRVIRGKIVLDQAVYEEVIEWAKNYIADFEPKTVLEGMMLEQTTKQFQVFFAPDKFGYDMTDLRWSYVDYEFDSIHEQEALAKVLTMPELVKFMEKEIG